MCYKKLNAFLLLITWERNQKIGGWTRKLEADLQTMPCWSTWVVCGKENKMAFPKQQSWLHTWNPYIKGSDWQSCQINKIVKWRSEEITSGNNPGTNNYLIFVLKCTYQCCHQIEHKSHFHMMHAVHSCQSCTYFCVLFWAYFLLLPMLQQVQIFYCICFPDSLIVSFAHFSNKADFNIVSAWLFEFYFMFLFLWFCAHPIMTES